MITSTYFGLYNAQRGLQAAQAGLNVVNQNISNANTAGYSRQRVDLSAVIPAAPSFSGVGRVGQGVSVDQVSRIHDNFLDGQFRTENSTLGQSQTLRDALTVSEGILNEPSDNGLSASIQSFFNAAQDVSQYPQSTPSRTVFLQSAKDLLNTFQQKATQLTSERQNLVGDASIATSVSNSQLATTIGDINSKVSSIADLNRQIVTTTAAGGQPNDLLDKRDKLLDDLSKLANITVTPTNNGLINVTVGGTLLVKGATVADTLRLVANTNTGPFSSSNPDPQDVPSLIQTSAGSTNLNGTFTGGSVAGILLAGGNPANQTSYKSLINNLNTLFTGIADQVNDLQTDTHPGTGTNAGRDLTGAQATDDIFSLASGTNLAIFRYSVNPVLLANPGKLAAAINDPAATMGTPAGFAGVGDGRNALAMAQIQNQSLAALGSVSPQSYFNQTISRLGVDSKSSSDKTANQNDLLTQIDQRRTSVSGVNQDEELVNMLQFQRAFEASAKLITTFDQTIQTILGMV